MLEEEETKRKRDEIKHSKCIVTFTWKKGRSLTPDVLISWTRTNSRIVHVAH